MFEEVSDEGSDMMYSLVTDVRLAICPDKAFLRTEDCVLRDVGGMRNLITTSSSDRVMNFQGVLWY